MKLHQPEYGTLNEGDPFANSYYADYERGFEQWQMWAQRASEQQQQRRRSRNNRRSLLIENVDPRVESHMKWVPKTNKNMESKMEAKRAALPTMKEPRRRWLSRDNNNETPKRPETAEFMTIHHGEQQYKNDFESVCSTVPVSESDDSSDGRDRPSAAAAFHLPASVDPTIPFNLQMSRSLVVEQEAMIRALEQQQQQQQGTPYAGHARQQPRNDDVTLLPADRVKRAMERGDSIRMLECSGCCRQLLVTTDFPLVYCADCQCFSHLDTSS
uniref:Uncharacterized protein n=1 Tax=Amphora coffeiformis TaxID=265554 RepID=A0A7S3P585_9STRA